MTVSGTQGCDVLIIFYCLLGLLEKSIFVYKGLLTQWHGKKNNKNVKPFCVNQFTSTAVLVLSSVEKFGCGVEAF